MKRKIKLRIVSLEKQGDERMRKAIFRGLKSGLIPRWVLAGTPYVGARKFKDSE